MKITSEEILRKFQYLEKEFCIACNEPLFTYIEHNNKEFIVPKLCKCQLKEKYEFERREKQKEFESNIERLIKTGLYMYKYTQNTFNNANNTNEKQIKAIQTYIANWESIKNKSTGILLYGSVGSGKTFLATCLLNELLKRDVNGGITSLPKMLSEVINFNEKSQEYVEKIKNIKFLVIDDFGTERTTEFAQEQIFNIIDERLNNNTVTVFTTNLSIEELKNPKTLMAKRIYSRVLQMTPIRILVNENDNRNVKTTETQAEIREILIKGEQNGTR